MEWLVGIGVVIVVVLLFQIVRALAPIGAYYELRNAQKELDAEHEEFERIRNAVRDDDEGDA